MKRWMYIVLVVACALSACKPNIESAGEQLSFSADTVHFDTVFSTIASSTRQVMVYNRHRQDVSIKRIRMREGTHFQANIDGTQPETLRDITLRGGDSMYVFVRVETTQMQSNEAVMVEDDIVFELEDKTQQIHLEATSQDVVQIKSKHRRTNALWYHFTAEKPYLISDTVVVNGLTLIDAGARLYFHQGASLVALGSVKAEGTLEEPIVLRGDRLDHLFDSVPYLYAAGGWGGLYLQHDASSGEVEYTLSYVDVLSANVGVFATSDQTENLPKMQMNGCRIHNHAMYGLVLQNIDAEIVNTEISNCASYCVYLNGGEHKFVHSTIASYFNFTTVNIQSVAREDVAAVYIDNLQKHGPQTHSSFYNSIITGVRKNQLVVATPLDKFYPGEIVGCYLKTDTLAIPHAHDNVYAGKDDTVFVNNFYKYKEYNYYDFRLDSVSPAIGIADEQVSLLYPTDRLGIKRKEKADAGCYESEGRD